MNDPVRVFSKSWLPVWLIRLATLKPTAQTIGVWMAAQADEAGRIEHLDKSALCATAGIHLATLKRELSPNGQLLQRGLVAREVRRIVTDGDGVAFKPTVYQLDVG